MILFAFGVKCGLFGASGLAHFVRPSAAHTCCAKKPSSSSPASATPTNPAPISHRSCRRVRPQQPPGAEARRMSSFTPISVLRLLFAIQNSLAIQEEADPKLRQRCRRGHPEEYVDAGAS